MANLLGIDFGTTALKACLFNDKGERLTDRSVRYELITNGEFIEFPTERFFEIIVQVISDIKREYKIDALAIDTQGETLIVLDKEGKPLLNAIIWLDNRALKQAKDFERDFGVEKIYNLTGQAEIPAGYPAPKIKWIEENMPEVFAKADKFLLLEDYIIYRLTGKACASRSLYSSSLLMDITTGEYIPEILDYLHITKNNLPTLHESGEVVGEYQGIKVVVSALDQIAGITGAGVVEKGLMSETTGTCLSVCAITDKLPKFVSGSTVSSYYVKKGLLCLLMYAPTAGATLEWFRGVFCDDVSYDQINALASQVPCGSEGLICIPHLCGTVVPTNNPSVKGTFYGIELKHKRGHFIRSIMESIAYTIKEYVDILDLPINEIRSMGGGAKSELWCNIKSSVLDKKIVTLKENETACLGSAIFAGVGANIFNDISQATKSLISTKDSYKGSLDYDKLYIDYKNKSQEILKTY